MILLHATSLVYPMTREIICDRGPTIYCQMGKDLDVQAEECGFLICGTRKRARNALHSGVGCTIEDPTAHRMMWQYFYQSNTLLIISEKQGINGRIL